MDRRSFQLNAIKGSVAISIGGSAQALWIQNLANCMALHPRNNDRVLVVVQLSGGNDGLNTIIPIRDELYFKARPKLAIAKDSSITIDSDTGLHPSMQGIARLIEANRFCALQGVGYPSPNRSHFESMDIWHSCQTKHARTKDGWLGRLAARRPVTPGADAFSLHLGSEPLPAALTARSVQVPSLSSLEQMQWKATSPEFDSKPVASASNAANSNNLLDFVSSSTNVARNISERLASALARPDGSVIYPKSNLAEKLQWIARLIAAGFTTRIYYVTLDGFDTHANQIQAHSNLLRQWSDAIEAFHNHMNQLGQGDRVAAFTFSEFGRRVAENASLGTDHGAAAPVFLSGPTFPRILIGNRPDLSSLEDGDLRYIIDFRSVYRSLIEDWLQLPSTDVVHGNFDKVKDLHLRS